jgi:hypothetical protein
MGTGPKLRQTSRESQGLAQTGLNAVDASYYGSKPLGDRGLSTTQRANQLDAPALM